jgi:hypothetical protein
MRNVTMLVVSLACSASMALANDPLTQIAQHARELASDYRKMTVTLKDKNFATQDLQEELREADVALAKVKELLAEHAATNPAYLGSKQKDWKLTQDLVTLLNIFQSRKAELLAGDNPHKKRNTIRDEAQGLVTRATMLEKAALRLAAPENTGS